MNVLRLLRERPSGILLLVGILVAAGVFTGIRLPAAIFPTVTFPLVKVIADVGEEPAARMMPTVTRPLEEAALRVPGIRQVLSTTSRGSTEISAGFAWRTDMPTALQRMQAEVNRIRPDLPPDARIDVEWMNTAIFPILGYAITSQTRRPAELRALAEFTLKPELIRIPGVSQVQVQGGRDREFQVRLDSHALAARRLSPADVVTAIQKNNTVLSAGLTEANHELYLSLVDGRVTGVDAIAAIPVAIPGGGVPARIGDLGSVSAADAVSYVRTTANGRPAVLINLIQQPTANTVAIAREVARLLREKRDLLPADVAWTVFYDQAEFVSRSVGGVRDAILIGVVLAGIVLLLFLRDLRLTLVAVAVIPVCVAIVLLLLDITGQTVNLMTLGGIAAAIGLIADDAIVVVEKVHRKQEEGRADPSGSGVSELVPALVGSSLSTIVIFLPFALLTGVAGAFFQPLALTMALALSVSFFLATLVVPLMTRRAAPPRPARAVGRRESRIEHALGFFLRRPAVSVLACLSLFGGAVLLSRIIGSDFLPEMDEGSIILDYWTPPGTSLTDTDDMLAEGEKIIRSLPDVETYSRRTGTQLGFFITEPNSGDYVIRLKRRKNRRPVDEIIDDLRDRLAAAEPAIHTDFGQLLEDDIGDLTGGTPQPIDVKIFGADQALLQQKAKETARILSSVRGVEDVFDGIVIAGPALNVRPRSDPLAGIHQPARFGLTTEDLHGLVEPAVTGTVAGSVLIGERVYDVRVFEDAPGGLANLKVRTPSGALVPLSTLATVSTGPPEAEIQRENLKSYLGVKGRLSGRDLGSAIAEIRRDLRSRLDLPSGMDLRFGGLYEQQQASFKGLLLVLVGGLVLVSVVLLFEFGDWRAPVLTAAVALSVLAGVFGALLASGMTLNLSSFVGAIMMVGIVGENAVFVIHEAQSALRNGASPPEAWRHAARIRVRPVVMTILAGVFALAPLALALGEGSQLQQPLAIAVIGGFVLSGPLVLAVLPSLYLWLDPRGRLAGASRAQDGSTTGATSI